jgi:diguanylate cyclase (GGDEF)-like protein
MRVSTRTGSPPRVLGLVVPVAVAGIFVTVLSAVTFATDPHDGSTLLALAAFVLAAALAERYPVPVDGVDTGGVTLLYVFAVAPIALFGWAAGVLVVVPAAALAHLLDHRPPVRVLYNCSVYALAAFASGIVLSPVTQEDPALLLVQLCALGTVNYVVNMALITGVVSLASRKPYFGLVTSAARSTIVPFALMASAALMLVVLWQRSPLLSVALIGPLLAIALYQRSTHKALRAMRLALTDPLTGLGNHRHFQDRLHRELVHAAQKGGPFTLCLLDIDDLKRINDRYGHPTGDKVLSHIAARLRQNGEAFRLGGDEFALLLPGEDATMAQATATAIVERIASVDLDALGPVTVSAGFSSFPEHGTEREELIRLADSALYWAKEHGKNRVRVWRPDVVELSELRKLAAGPDRAARYRAAASLAKAVDARDAYTGSHSQRVSELAARVALRLGLDQEMVELTRLAGSLHDLGKLAVPEEILRKPGPLTDGERLVLERHPQIGFRMLESLGVDPLADWVLHHHERWDGTGYPDGLPGSDIPIGARIIFVVDAYDAMTTERVYQRRRSHAEALGELDRCAGTQFDPIVVAALEEEFALEFPEAGVALAPVEPEPAAALAS